MADQALVRQSRSQPSDTDHLRVVRHREHGGDHLGEQQLQTVHNDRYTESTQQIPAEAQHQLLERRHRMLSGKAVYIIRGHRLGQLDIAAEGLRCLLLSRLLQLRGERCPSRIASQLIAGEFQMPFRCPCKC